MTRKDWWPRALVGVLGLSLGLGLAPGVSSIVAANLVPNPGFEDLCSTAPCNWHAITASSGLTSAIASSTIAHSGSRSMQITAKATLVTQGAVLSDCVSGLTPGTYNEVIWYNT